MGHALTFDTLAYAKKLIAAGVPEKQAEVQAEALAELVDDQLTTKKDLKEPELALTHKIKELELNLPYALVLCLLPLLQFLPPLLSYSPSRTSGYLISLPFSS